MAEYLLNVTVHGIDATIELIVCLCPFDDRIKQIRGSILVLAKLVGDNGLVIILLIHVRDKRWTNARPTNDKQKGFHRWVNRLFETVSLCLPIRCLYLLNKYRLEIRCDELITFKLANFLR